jgi:hypothetical protein
MASVDSAPDRTAPETPSAPVPAEVFGAELARSVIEQARQVGDGVQALSHRLSLDSSRVVRELGYLSLFTMRFCIGAALDDDAARARVLEAFYATLWTDRSWGPHVSGFERRALDYEHAFNNPHPDFGRGYGIGRAFARWCHARDDVAVIELGARAYVEQLPRILGVLRSTRVA